MKILILGASGFIGKNLTNKLLVDNNFLVLADKDISRLETKKNTEIVKIDFCESYDFKKLLNSVDIVYHLICSSLPNTTDIVNDIKNNVVVTAKLLESCVSNNVKQFIFLSSGGTVYGKDNECPLNEEMKNNPICSYGITKLTIEKLLYLYNYIYGLDYRIIRLSNPFGPYQRPNNNQGIITNFLYKRLKDEKIQIYGDGSIVRDYIYIDDAIDAIMNICNKKDSKYKLYNVGSGFGTSINELLKIIENILNDKLDIEYIEARKQDVPINYLDITRYESEFGKIQKTSLSEGIARTNEYLNSLQKE